MYISLVGYSTHNSDVGDANQEVAAACQGMGLTFPQVATDDHQNLPLWLPPINLVAAMLRIDLVASRKRT